MPSTTRTGTVRWLLLLLLLAAAAWLRAQGLDFGLPALNDPDEPIFALLALRLLREGTLNPAWFGHPGTTTIYALAMVDVLVFAIGSATGRFAGTESFAAAIYADPGVVILPGRMFIVACGLLTIALSFVLARRLFGDRVAWLAAALLAIDPVHTRYSQIIRTDMQATVFMLLSLLAAVQVAREGRRRDYLVAGVWLGIACATKWPSALGCVAIAGACVTRMVEHPDDRRRQFRNLCLAALAAVAALFAASPYLLLDYRTVAANLLGEARPRHLGATGHGLLGNAWWYLSGPLRTALGAAGLVLTTVGLVVAGRRSRAFLATVVPLLVVMFVAISAQSLVWERWTVPLLPLMTVAMAVGIVAVARWVSRGVGERWRWPAGVATAGALTLSVAIPATVTIRGNAAERRTDTRQLATEWARRHIAPGSTVIVEHLAFDVLDRPWRFLFPVGSLGCVDALAALRGRVRYSQIGQSRGPHAIIDLGSIASATLPSCRADYAILVNYDRYLAEADRFPEQVALYGRVVRPGSVLATFRPERGRIGGPVVRVVRVGRRFE